MTIRYLPVKAARKADKRREHDAWRARLGRGRYPDLVKEVAGIIRLQRELGTIFTPFGLEGALRHKIRSDLCLMFWRWADADRMAREMLADVFASLNAVRPSWKEGQPDWTVEAGTLIEREHCAYCYKSLPEGHYKFCSYVCGSRSRQAHYRLLAASEESFLDLVIKRRD